MSAFNFLSKQNYSMLPGYTAGVKSYTGKPFEPIVKTTVSPRKFLTESKYTPPSVGWGTAKYFLPELAKNLKGIQEEIAKSGASIFLTMSAPLTGKREIKIDPKDPQYMQTFHKAFFGEKPIKAIETRIAESELDIKQWGKQMGIKPEAPLMKHALPTAALGVGGVIGLDFTGWGGGKQSAFKALSKITKLDDTFKFLTKAGIPEDIAKAYSPSITKMKQEVDVAKALKAIENVLKTTKATPKVVKPTLLKVKPDPLITEAQILRGTKGMTADDIMKKHPNIKLKRDVPAKDIYGNKVEIPEGETLTPYELKGNKILLQDGETYIVSKNQFQNIKGQSVSGEAKPFAPELKGTEETIRGGKNLEEEIDALLADEVGQGMNRQQAKEFILQDAESDVATKYSQYQLPDGKNYKEILIKAPKEKAPTLKEYFTEGNIVEGYGGKDKVIKFYPNGKPNVPMSGWSVDVAEIKKDGSLGGVRNHSTMPKLLAPTYKSPHWDEPNVLFHLRMNERTYKGKKVSFMEETQSDWAREARDGKGVPQHPLLKNEQKLSIKRVLQEAVNNKSDYFAWINGEQTSARYNLATHLENVKWKTSGQGSKSITLKPKQISEDIFVIVNKKGEITAGKNWHGKRIDEVLGKGLADKIMAKETGTLSGEGLKFGGEWASNLYDKQVKNIVQDLTGGKVEVLDMGLPVEKHQRFFKIKNEKDVGTVDLKSVSKSDAGKGVTIGQVGSRSDYYIITDVLGKGKFKAFRKSNFNTEELSLFLKGKLDSASVKELKRMSETFDISIKKTTQQGIKLTPEIKAKIKGEALELKTSEKMFEAKAVKEVKPVAKAVETPIKKVIESLRKAKPLRGEQEIIYAKERGKKLAKALEAGRKVSGEKGFIAEKGAMKGAMTKVEFEEIRSKVGQKDIDELFNQIKESYSLNEWDKLPAREGFAKLLSGQVPTKGEIKLLDKVFGEEVTKTLLTKVSLLKRITNSVFQLANIPRSLMASWDLSAPLRQGIFLAPSHPKQFFSAFKTQMKVLFSEKNFKILNEEIASRPNAGLMRKYRLGLTDLGEGLANREEVFMSSWAEKIPLVGYGVRASSRAYVGFLNKLRADVFDNFVKTGKELGLDKNPRYLRDSTNFINNATGRGGLAGAEKIAVELNSTFFSPRLTASRLSLINPVYYITLQPAVRKKALKSLFSFAGLAITVAGLAKLGGAKIEDDPRNADFAKLRFGNTRYDILGGFQQPIRLAAQFISGKVISSTTGKVITLGEGYKPLTRVDIVERFLEYKTSPIASFAIALMKGQSALGEKLDIPMEVKNRFVPMVMQDIYELYEERGSEGIVMGIPAIFGVGTMSYGGTQSYGLRGEEYKELNEELRRIKSSIGFPSTQAFGQELSNKEYKELKEKSGKVITGILSEIIAEDSYKELLDYEKIKIVNKVVRRVKDRLKESLFSDKKIINELKKRLVKKGIDEDKAEKIADEIYQAKFADKLVEK